MRRLEEEPQMLYKDHTKYVFFYNTCDKTKTVPTLTSALRKVLSILAEIYKQEGAGDRYNMDAIGLHYD